MTSTTPGRSARLKPPDRPLQRTVGESAGAAGEYEPVIGLEVHVQLRTQTKIFCGCANAYGGEPNTRVCPICLGYPGTLPVLNQHAVELAVRIASAMDAEICPTSIFARKNYFYADLPKGYQISQFDKPVARGGALPLTLHDHRVAVHRLHLEEDAGKLLHEAPGGRPLPGLSLVDFNRAGVPLVEIVTEPVLHTSAEAQDFLQSLRQLLLYTEVSDANMEEGSLRCDANISVRPRGETRLGSKAEIKNLNSFRHVGRAIDFEILRQVRALEEGGQVVQETRTFNVEDGTTSPMRGKEGSDDYRYFPEPDLPPLRLASETIRNIRASLPALPWQRRQHLADGYQLPLDDARLLTTSRQLADYFEAACATSEAEQTGPRSLANWIKTEILRELKERSVGIDQAIAPDRLGGLVSMVDSGQLSSSGGKSVLAAMWDDKRKPRALAEELGLLQVRDTSQLKVWIEQTLDQNAPQVEQFRTGKEGVLGFLIGQVMKRSGGRADPKLARDLLRRAILDPSVKFSGEHSGSD